MNVVLNVFFILAFGLDVEGVAIATVISTTFSAVMCLRLLIKNKDGVVKLEKKYIRFYKEEFKEIALVGIPSGVQSALFGISNVLIQSTVNSFGNAVMAGDTCAKQLEHFIGQVLPGISQAGVAFVSQNYGAKNFKRIKTSIFSGLLLILITGALVSTALILITVPFSRLMLTEKEAIEYTILRSKIMLTTFTVCSMMDYFAYVLRGLNKSITAMIITLVGVCLVRVLWIKLIFPLSPTLSMLYVCYPITWAITLIILLVCVIVRYINEKKRYEKEQMINAYNGEIE
jgi:Na+-driven multidrug efflux pump